jgi:uncharacterized surface protein with fasciclin (FAS1) repeats
MLKKLVPFLMILAVASTGLVALASDASTHATKSCGMSAAAAPVKLDIVGTAVQNPNFSTLVAALKAAGLVETLKGSGPFTVFAPTNEAFAKLPAGTVEHLLKPENKAQLQEVLTYHVLAGNVRAKDIQQGETDVKTLQGQTLEVKKNVLGNVTINDATVIIPDVVTSNGTIHAIDTVLIP